jgi:large subunit ribosomal protein L4
MKAPIYDQKGKQTKEIELPSEVFEVSWNADLMHDVLISMAANRRSNTAHAKDRSEVRGGGKKPWRQKGTGRARHGSIRSPLWRGGGTTFGPRNDRNYDKKINKKVRAKALAMTLSKKAADGELILVDSLQTEGKTKDASVILSALAKNKDLEKLSTKKNNAALIALAGRDEKIEKSFRNISNTRLDLVQNMNVSDLADYKFVIVEKPEETLEVLKNRVSTKK